MQSIFRPEARHLVEENSVRGLEIRTRRWYLEQRIDRDVADKESVNCSRPRIDEHPSGLAASCVERD